MNKWLLLVLFSFTAVSPAIAQKYELQSKYGDIAVGLSISQLSNSDKSFVTITYRDNSIPPGTPLANFQVPTKALSNLQESSGSINVWFPLPGCAIPLSKKGRYQYKDGIFEVETTVTSGEMETWKPECRAGINPSGFTARVSFPPLTQKDRAALGLFSDKEMGGCKFIHGQSIPLAGIEGKVLTAYPNGWAHDADGYYTGSQSWADMTVNTLTQTGPQNWANGKSYVFLLGDEVTVQRVVQAPRPGTAGGFVRTHLVEVKRNSDGLVGVVDLHQFYSGSLEGCPKEKLVFAGAQLIPGIFVKLRPNARPIYDSNKNWVNNPGLRYGFCQDFREGRLSCQTREFGRTDLAPSSWLVYPDEFDVVSDFPLRGKKITFNLPGGGTISH